MARSALRSVGDAIDVTRGFLTPPTVGRIGRLAPIVVFLGAPGTPLPTSPSVLDPTLWRIWEDDAGESGPEVGEGTDGESTGAGADAGPADALAIPEVDGLEGVSTFDPGTWPAWLLAGVALAVALALTYALLGVVMRFVLVEGFRRDVVRIRGPARRYLRPAIAVAAIRIGLGAVGVGVLLVAARAIATSGGGRLALLGVGTATAAAVGSLWLVDRLAMQFGVPAVVGSDGRLRQGFCRAGAAVRRDPVEYALFLVVRALLGVATGIAAVVAIAVPLAIVGLALGTVGATVVVLAGGVGSLGPVAVAVLAGLVVVFLAVALVVAAVVFVPLQVYLWSYALLVLGDTDPRLDLLPELRASARRDDAQAGW